MSNIDNESRFLGFSLFTCKNNRLYSFFLACLTIYRCTQRLFLSLSSLKVTYEVYWNCSQCHYDWYNVRGSTSTHETKYTISWLQRGLYVFSVHAHTRLGDGKNASVSLEYSGNYGQVKDLTATVGSDYTITVQWKPPPYIDSKEITVCNIFISLEVLQNSTKGAAILVN